MFIRTVRQRLARLIEELAAVNVKLTADPVAILRCYHVTQNAAQDIEAAFNKHSFTDEAEEISFFKEIRPQVDGRLFYYARLLYIVQRQPVGTAADKSAYYQRCFAEIQQFFSEHRELQAYNQLGFQHLDSVYFTRPVDETVPEPCGFLPFLDQRRYARKSYQYACLVGYDLLLHDLEMAVQGPVRARSSEKDEGLTWTASQAGLTELIYGLNEMGAFNHRKMDIKKLADYLAGAFNVKIANIYKTHEDNRLRKKARTPFVDELRKKLLDKYDYDDEHAL